MPDSDAGVQKINGEKMYVKMFGREQVEGGGGICSGNGTELFS